MPSRTGVPPVFAARTVNCPYSNYVKIKSAGYSTDIKLNNDRPLKCSSTDLYPYYTSIHDRLLSTARFH